MNIYELVEKVGGEIVAGRAKVRVGSKYIVVGRVVDNELTLTDEGREMVEEFGKVAVAEVVEEVVEEVKATKKAKN